MNTKFVVAVLFALVSVSLCEVPAPSQELVEKYDALKTKFYKRLLAAYSKTQEKVAPLLENAGNYEHAQKAKEFFEDLQTKPEFQAAVRVASGVGAEAGPLVDKARTTLLGLYEYYLRPHIGNGLSDSIDFLKVYLDQYMPAE